MYTMFIPSKSCVSHFDGVASDSLEFGFSMKKARSFSFAFAIAFWLSQDKYTNSLATIFLLIGNLHDSRIKKNEFICASTRTYLIHSKKIVLGFFLSLKHVLYHFDYTTFDYNCGCVWLGF